VSAVADAFLEAHFYFWTNQSSAELLPMIKKGGSDEILNFTDVFEPTPTDLDFDSSTGNGEFDIKFKQTYSDPSTEYYIIYLSAGNLTREIKIIFATPV
jgi:hypothetical protein